MIKACLVCGKEFITYPSKIKLGRGKYCSKACCLRITSLTGKEGKATRFKKGQKPWSYKGWRYTQGRHEGNEYIEVFTPDHPNSTKAGYVRLHRLIMEKKIGRYLLSDEIVHHKDENSLNNAPDNLELMKKREHDKINTHLNIHKRWK